MSKRVPIVAIESNEAAAAQPRSATLAAHQVVCLLTNRDLVVQRVEGQRALLADLEPLVGRPLFAVTPELAARAADLTALLAGERRRLDIGLVPRASAAGVRYWWAQTSASRGKNGRILGVNHLLADATALGEHWERSEGQRRELAELRQKTVQLNLEVALAQSEVRRLDDAKSQFVSAAAHELRNPLAALIGYLELIELEGSASLNDAQRDYLAGISRSAHRLRALTSNLLDITRIDANRLELVMSTMDALELVEQAVSEMQPLFDAKRQRVHLRAEPGLPLIWCDRVRALQILTNLLSNAHKYTPEEGAITVSVYRIKNAPQLCIRVKDTGIGIPAEDQYGLFTRFHRARNATAADDTGAGLGLAITQSLVRLHGGRLWFESKEGKGATFYVTFAAAG